MSQHDEEITQSDANTGPTMRAAINAALQALSSLQSGASAPPALYPCQLWADTGNNLLKMRNIANTEWLTIGKLDNAFLALLSLYTAQTITAQHIFNPTSAIAPFALGTNAQGQKVIGLNADTVDGVGLDESSRFPWSTKPAFRGALVKRTTYQVIPNATPTKVQWNAEEYDTDNIHTTDCSPPLYLCTRLTIPAEATKFQFFANTMWESDLTGRRDMRLLKNGNIEMGCPAVKRPAQGTSEENFASPVLFGSTGDYYELQVYQNSGGNLRLGGTSGEYLNNVWFAMKIVE